VQRLLVLKDEPEIGKVVSRAMSSARVQLDCTADGRSGLELARSGHHDLVLLDLLRPSPGRGGQRRADRHGRQADAAGDLHADTESHERVDRAPGHHHADREVARS
jgi:CheY-like chemotaxis protein